MNRSNRKTYFIALSIQALTAWLLSSAPSVHAEALRDPTQPPVVHAATGVAVPEAPAALRVEAIFSTGARRSAIVNGKLVRAGDRVGAAVIQEITGDTVRYVRDGRSQVSRLKSSRLRVRSSAAAKSEDPS